MVVLSAAICTKAGKALIARQFVEMTRIRIEGLLAAFPKLLGSDSKQHTFVETDAVRYLYQPLDTMYILIITNRASNIIEDLETLRLLSKVVPDAVGTGNNLTEEKISDKSFELLFSFDEVITAGGYREPITLQQIRTNLEMESHEEKLHNMIKLSKMESAKDQARDAAISIREKQRENIKSGTSLQGIGSSLSHDSSPAHFETRSDVLMASSSVAPASKPVQKASSVRGMSLTAASKSKSLEDALVKEDKLAPVIKSAKASDSSLPPAPVINHPVMLSILEKVSAVISRDGIVESFEVKGNLTLTAMTEEASICCVKLSQSSTEAFSFSTHPKVNKALYDKSGALQLKDLSKGFPTARPVGILKWSLIGGNDHLLPFKINCWPEEESRGIMNVSIEYSLETDVQLHGVKVKIPLGTNDSPSVVSVDGNYKHNPSSGELIWEIDIVDQSNPSGSLEFHIPQKKSDAFFPIVVQFFSNQLFCNIDVAGVQSVEEGKPFLYGLEKGMSTEEYIIG